MLVCFIYSILQCNHDDYCIICISNECESLPLRRNDTDEIIYEYKVMIAVDLISTQQNTCGIDAICSLEG